MISRSTEKQIPPVRTSRTCAADAWDIAVVDGILRVAASISLLPGATFSPKATFPARILNDKYRGWPRRALGMTPAEVNIGAHEEKGDNTYVYLHGSTKSGYAG